MTAVRPPDAAAAVLAIAGEPAAALLAGVERRLAEVALEYGPELGEHAAATIAAGGKRLRPLLVSLAAGVPAPESLGLLRAAVAVELIHSATLVHDDVLDRAALRRGRPTVFAQGGRLVATAVGDLLFSRAFAELAATESDRARASVQVLALASTELAAGELMQRADAYDTTVTIERYLERCRLKTGVLFRASCELGAIEGAVERERLARFGEQIGIAFQLLDDVLDVSGPVARTGKPRGTDLLDGTVTLPLIVARARGLGDVDLREVRDPVTAEALCERIAATGALEESRARALALVAAAKTELGPLPDRQRHALELAADGVVERYA